MEGSRRTIVYVDNSTGLTGGFKSMAHVIGELRDRYRIVVVSPDKSFAKKHIPGAEHHQIRFLEIRKDWKLILYPLMLAVNSVRLLKLVKQYEDPVLHMNDFYNLTGCGVKFLNKSIPLIYHVRLLPTSYIGPVYHRLSRIVQRYADQIVCCSRAVFNALPQNSRKVVIYDAMKPPSEIKHPKKAPPEVLYLSNYVPGKGHEFALKIFGHLSELHPEVRLRFLGGTLGKQGNEVFKKKLINEASRLGLQDRITFDGFVEDVNVEVQQATILLNCSESESFSMVCLEGLFNETCVVTLDSGGPAELIQHEETGLIFAIGTGSKEIAIQINRLLEDPGLRTEMERKGKAYALDNFTQKDTITDLEKIYSQL